VCYTAIEKPDFRSVEIHPVFSIHNYIRLKLKLCAIQRYTAIEKPDSRSVEIHPVFSIHNYIRVKFFPCLLLILESSRFIIKSHLNQRLSLEKILKNFLINLFISGLFIFIFIV